MQMELSSNAAHPGELLFDWQIDVSRLEKEAFEAKQLARPNPWALVEAECSLDLVDAEIAAAKASSPGKEREQTLAHLNAWRLRLVRVIRNLGTLSGDAS